MRKIVVLPILLTVLLSSCAPKELTNNERELNEIKVQIDEICDKINSMENNTTILDLDDKESIINNDKKYEDLIIRIKSIEDKLYNIEEQIKAIDDMNNIDKPLSLKLNSTWDSIDYENHTTEINLTIENSKAQFSTDLIIEFFLNENLLHIIPYPQTFAFSKKEGEDIISIKYKIPYIVGDRMVVRVYDKLLSQLAQTEFSFSDLGD